MREDVLKALEVLKKGGIILYPTDTIWGIGCDATSAEAVSKIYKLKQRDDSKSMLVLLDNQNRLQGYVNEVPEVAWELIDVADKPMTIIYPGAKNLAKNLIAEDGSIGIRICKDNFCAELISRFKKPLVSTSANISGANAPANFSEINDLIKDSVDYIVSWRQKETKQNTSSSIIKLGTSGEIQIIR
jgi:L-threonylcarbamoyladenylate synthase